MSHNLRYGIVSVDTENPQMATLSGRWHMDTLDITLDGHPAGVTGIMNACETLGARATFFIDVYESARFASVRTIVEGILKRGHDVQLHTHPAWMFDRQRVHMWEYSLEEQREIVGVGSELLSEWTGKRPIGHRAGACGADFDTLVALRECGIAVDSSYRPEGPNSRLTGPVNQIRNIHGVVELPIIGFDYQVNYQLAGLSLHRWRAFQPLDLDACTLAQLQWFLGAMEESKAPILDLSFHSYSLIKWDRDFHSAHYNPNDYSKLIEFLREGSETYGIRWITLSEFWRLYSEDRSRFLMDSRVPRRVEERSLWTGCMNRLRRKISANRA